MALQYELFYLVAESKESELPRIKEAVEKLVLEHGGTWLPETMEEKRKLAYPIKHETRGTYIVRRFTVPGVDERTEDGEKNRMGDLSHQLNLYRDILRFILVRAEGLPALGEREVVPQIERGNSRKRDARPERTDRVTAPVSRPVVAAPAPVKTEAVPITPVVEEVKEEKMPEKVEGAEKAEMMEEAVEPKKVAKKKAEKKEVLNEEEIDKKLDEVLNL